MLISCLDHLWGLPAGLPASCLCPPAHSVHHHQSDFADMPYVISLQWLPGLLSFNIMAKGDLSCYSLDHFLFLLLRALFLQILRHDWSFCFHVSAPRDFSPLHSIPRALISTAVVKNSRGGPQALPSARHCAEDFVSRDLSQQLCAARFELESLMFESVLWAVLLPSVHCLLCHTGRVHTRTRPPGVCWRKHGGRTRAVL